MLKTLTSIVFAAALTATASAMVFAAALAATASASAVNAAPTQPGVDLPSSLTIQVSGDCGPDAWRGPWGHCRNTPFHGRLPNGRWV
jgi:Spy/CpxP family protein refolding chaperone